ncbi:MAG TPA: phosphatidylserine decarboxylase [Candidatus Binataceae bacterium]|nr:phosphatidylserine decarboxylase [Candidatus Binataceae bacterium]
MAITAAALVAWLMDFWWLAIPALIAAVAVACFFRDPERNPERISNVVLSGADGKVTDIEEASLPGAPQRRFRRVSVFMSPLNVHINRASVSGEVMSVNHAAGEFRAAFRDYASEHNERNSIVLEDVDGRQHALVQIAGYLARRIVCRLNPHDKILAGQRIGLIMFGSRVDHYLPLDYRVAVKPGDRVRAGESIIGELP